MALPSPAPSSSPSATAAAPVAPDLIARDLGLADTWWAIITSPRAFFVRVGVHAGVYGQEELVRSGQGPDAFIFYFVMWIVGTLVAAVVGGTMAGGLALVFGAALRLVGVVAGFYLAAGYVHLLTRLVRLPGDFEAAKAAVAFTSALTPLMMVAAGLASPGTAVIAALATVYTLVMMALAVRGTYAASIPKAAFVFVFWAGGLAAAAALGAILGGR